MTLPMIIAIFVIAALLAIIYLIYNYNKNYHLASSEERLLQKEADHFDELAKKYGEAAKKYESSNVIPFRPRRPPTLVGQTGAEGWDANGSPVVDSLPSTKDSASHNIGPADNS